MQRSEAYVTDGNRIIFSHGFCGIYLFFGRSYSAAKEQAYEALIGTVMATITGIGITEALVSAVISAAVCIPLFKYLSKNA